MLNGGIAAGIAAGIAIPTSWNRSIPVAIPAFNIK